MTDTGDKDRLSYPRDAVSLLSRAIDCAQQALAMRACFEGRRVSGLLDDLAAAARKPCVDGRLIDDHTLIFGQAVQLADLALHQYDHKRAQLYGRVISALLPDIQRDLLRALEQRAKGAL